MSDRQTTEFPHPLHHFAIPRTLMILRQRCVRILPSFPRKSNQKQINGSPSYTDSPRFKNHSSRCFGCCIIILSPSPNSKSTSTYQRALPQACSQGKQYLRPKDYKLPTFPSRNYQDLSNPTLPAFLSSLTSVACSHTDPIPSTTHHRMQRSL